MAGLSRVLSEAMGTVLNAASLAWRWTATFAAHASAFVVKVAFRNQAPARGQCSFRE